MTLLPRRTILRGSGAAIALPLLEAMLPSRPARANEPWLGRSGRPKRLVTVFSPNGIVPTTYWPTGGLRDFAFPTNGILEPLATHKQDLVILKGVRNQAAAEMPVPSSHPEGVFTMLTGRAPSGVRGQNFGQWRARGISLDQALARGPLGRTPLGSFGVGADGADWSGNLSFDANLRPVPHVTSPQTAFRVLFADPKATDAERAVLAGGRRSVLDGVHQACKRLAASLGAADRQRLEAHCTNVRELEQRLAVAPGSCGETPVAIGTASYQDINTVYEELPRIIDALSQLVVLALSCDQTNIVTFILKRGGGGSYYARFLGADFDNSSGVNEIHEMSHRVGQAAWDPKLTTIARFFMTQVATLVTRLKAVKLPDGGSLFDDVLVLHGSEVGTGDHNKNDIPFFLVGSGGGAVEPGRFLTYANVPHNQLLCALMLAFGASPEDAKTFDRVGAPGALPGLLRQA